jgi:hypothetical protein
VRSRLWEILVLADNRNIAFARENLARFASRRSIAECDLLQRMPKNQTIAPR